MFSPSRNTPYRWILPIGQFLVCVVILWPLRQSLLTEVRYSIHSYRHPEWKAQILNSQVKIELTAEWMREMEADTKLRNARLPIPTLLNSPVLLAELPYVLVHKKEWVPLGMSREAWRALSFPILGVVLWWVVGRAVEAIGAARNAIIAPKIGWTETIWSAILLCIGLMMLVGVFTSTPDDRADRQFVALMVGGCSWGVLAGITIAARILQRRIRRRNLAVLQ